MLNQFVAFAVNNLFLVVAGGLVAVYLAYRFWVKVDTMVRSISDWGELIFVAAKYVIIVAMLFGLGRWIYGTLNSAVIAAVNSGSVQTTGQAVVDIAGAVDQLVGWDGGAGLGSGMLTTSDLSNAIQMLQPATQSATENAAESATSTTLEFKPLEELFSASAPVVVNPVVQQAAVNAAINAPASAPVANYVVQPGDNLNAIAKRLGIDAKALCAANGLGNCSLIRVGQSLVMPGSVAASLTETVAADTSAKIRQVRPAAVGYYTEPKLNQSYIPRSWNVLEQGEMSVGAPALATPAAGGVFASFPTN
ncbi:MAG: LysM peptidoglycan-binding domain-containing protein [Desulfurellales bacterium]|nr:MAG: LysM peptidoglycan-binding domain-containing protein [Desulfurellales bacterium]